MTESTFYHWQQAHEAFDVTRFSRINWSYEAPLVISSMLSTCESLGVGYLGVIIWDVGHVCLSL